MTWSMVFWLRRMISWFWMIFWQRCGCGEVWQVVSRWQRVKVEWIIYRTMVYRVYVGVGRRFIVNLCRFIFRFRRFVDRFCRFIIRFWRIIMIQRRWWLRWTIFIQARAVGGGYCWLLKWDMIASGCGDKLRDGVDLVDLELLVAVDTIDCSVHCSVQDWSKECCRIRSRGI